MTTRVSVDPDLCMASGYCIRDLPAVFAEEPDGTSVVREDAANLKPDLAEPAHQAALACPAGAIEVTED